MIEKHYLAYKGTLNTKSFSPFAIFEIQYGFKELVKQYGGEFNYIAIAPAMIYHVSGAIQGKYKMEYAIGVIGNEIYLLPKRRY